MLNNVCNIACVHAKRITRRFKGHVLYYPLIVSHLFYWELKDNSQIIKCAKD